MADGNGSTGEFDRGSESDVQAKKLQRDKKKRPSWQGRPILIAIALVVAALVVSFVGRPYVIPSESMEPTLHGCPGCTQDRIYVEKVGYHLGDPKPGDVVVFVAPTSSWNGNHTSNRSHNAVLRGAQNFLGFFGLAPPDENDLVKRVIAVGGQTVQCCDAQGRVLVDGKPLDEPYVVRNSAFDPEFPQRSFAAGGRAFGPVKVPAGNLWVMGDNRANSADSRYHMTDELHGTVPVSDVRGKAVVRMWPLGRIGSIGAVNPQSH